MSSLWRNWPEWKKRNWSKKTKHLARERTAKKREREIETVIKERNGKERKQLRRRDIDSGHNTMRMRWASLIYLVHGTLNSCRSYIRGIAHTHKSHVPILEYLVAAIIFLAAFYFYTLISPRCTFLFVFLTYLSIPFAIFVLGTHIEPR